MHIMEHFVPVPKCEQALGKWLLNSKRAKVRASLW